MSDFTDSLNESRFPLVEDRAKGMKLLGVIIVGRALREIVVPAGSDLGRGMYAGALAAAMIYLLARPGLTRERAVLWAILGGLAVAGIMVS